jgi:hypothetical protein
MYRTWCVIINKALEETKGKKRNKEKEFENVSLTLYCTVAYVA